MSKVIFLRHLALDGVDDAHRSADLGRYPEFRAVALELGKARTRIDQHIGDDLARLGVDEMRHVGRFGGIDQNLAVRTDAHAFRLDADLHLAERHALLHIDDRDGVVVLVGDVQNLAGRILGEQFGIGPGRQGGDDLVRGGIDHLNGVVVADRDQDELSVLGQLDAARPLADLDGLHDLEFVGIDHADRVALFVRHIGGEAARLGAKQDAREPAPSRLPRHILRSPVIGLLELAFAFGPIEARACRVPKTGAGSLPAAIPKRPFGRRSAGSVDEAAGSSPAASTAGP